MGTRRRHARQSTMWVATVDLPHSAGHPFYERLNRLLDDTGFDVCVEARCAPFYAAGIGRPSLGPGRYFRPLLLGYFEGPRGQRLLRQRGERLERPNAHLYEDRAAARAGSTSGCSCGS